MNTQNDKSLKAKDVLNRRQEQRSLNLGIHDISCAKYFTINNETWRYKLTAREFESDYAVYRVDDVIECIGFAKPDRNKIIISVNKHGLIWESRIALSSIQIFGEKLPSH